MSKKKVQHKGKPKHAAEQDDDFSPNTKKEGNIEICEEYTTVLDYEVNKKYNKRLLESNWGKYSNLGDSENEEATEETPRTDDFAFLLKNASSDCSHFQFSSEKLWKSEENSIPSGDIFKLDVNVLAAGLACLPFHKRLGIDEQEISEDDLRDFEENAQKSRDDYEKILMRNKQVKDVVNEVQNKLVDKLKDCIREIILDEKNVESSLESQGSQGTTEESNVGNVNEVPKKIFYTENDENLEDWLDSVLDD